MKKIISYIILYIVFCLLQFSLGKYLNIFEIYPNFILIFVVYLGLLKGAGSAQLIGFLLGLTWDIFSTGIFGMKAVIFTVIGYFVGRASRNFDNGKIFAQSVIVFFFSIVYWVGSSFMGYIFYKGGNYAIGLFTLSNVVEIFVTALIAPVVFYILDLYV
ncbi:MAG: rod shape-determining protein MreD [Endomicrobium sp.]|jgi:rod shape-determining protein MreD|nr:rod shape-determining protein MreD [Endomicrobium sp.]